jgi:hypothetical protein
MIILLMKIKQKLPYHWLASRECRSTNSWWWGSSFHTHSETLPTCTCSPSSWPHTGQKFCSHKVHTITANTGVWGNSRFGYWFVTLVDCSDYMLPH